MTTAQAHIRVGIEPHSAAGRTRLRLTPRGRAVFSALVAVPLALAAVGFALNGGPAVATGRVSGVSPTYVTVQSGQSLWQIAGTIAPNADPRDVIAAIMSLNQLPSGIVQAGQQLAIPVEYSPGSSR